MPHRSSTPLGRSSARGVFCRWHVLVVVALLSIADLGAAQTAVLTGTVVRDSAGHALAGAQVTLPELRLATTANYAGEFRFARLPAGRHVVLIRHVGFAPRYDTLEIAVGARLDREFILSPQAVQLDEVRVVEAERKYISPALREFEERRKQGFGHFITEEQLRKNDNSTLVNVIIGHVPGVRAMRIEKRLGTEYLSSSRKCGSGPTFLTCRGSATSCPVTLYVDGVQVYGGTTNSDASSIPDLNQFHPRDYAAVEFYAGGASIPARFNKTDSGCGVLLLWSRER
jgi:hypothetical protein